MSHNIAQVESAHLPANLRRSNWWPVPKTRFSGLEKIKNMDHLQKHDGTVTPSAADAATEPVKSDARRRSEGNRERIGRVRGRAKALRDQLHDWGNTLVIGNDKVFLTFDHGHETLPMELSEAVERYVYSRKGSRLALARDIDYFAFFCRLRNSAA